MDCRVQKRATLCLYIIGAVRFCLMAGLAVFALTEGTAYTVECAVRGVEAVTELRGIYMGMSGNPPGYSRK